jgi:hypothetical protein
MGKELLAQEQLTLVLVRYLITHDALKYVNEILN